LTNALPHSPKVPPAVAQSVIYP